MKFNPEDGYDFGPHCRNCHKGSSNCGTCHSSGKAAQSLIASEGADSYTDFDGAKAGIQGKTILDVQYIGTQYDESSSAYSGTAANYIPDATFATFLKTSRTVAWPTDWRQSTTATDTANVINNICADDGFSWPHRTLGWKMLKDDLFGLDFDGTAISVGETRSVLGSDWTNATNNALVAGLVGTATHDIDSVCLDCHNPTIWNNSSSQNHTDTSGLASDNYDDELLLRGLP